MIGLRIDMTQSDITTEQLAIAITINRENYDRVDNSVQTTLTLHLVIDNEAQY